MNLFQTQEPQQLNPMSPQQQQDHATLPLDPSETATVHNVTELSEERIQNTESFTITNDSILIQVPTHNITPDITNNQNQDNITLNTTQDNTSILSTSNTNITQPFQTQQTPRQKFDPPPIPPHFSTQINTQNSLQQGSSNTQTTNTVHFQTTTPPTQHIVQTLTYAPAQSNQTQNRQTGLKINTLQLT